MPPRVHERRHSSSPPTPSQREGNAPHRLTSASSTSIASVSGFDNQPSTPSPQSNNDPLPTGDNARDSGGLVPLNSGFRDTLESEADGSLDSASLTPTSWKGIRSGAPAASNVGPPVPRKLVSLVDKSRGARTQALWNTHPPSHSVFSHLKKFLEYTPPKHIQLSSSSGRSTRPPAAYDNHLPRHQQLSRIIVVPEMPRLLSASARGKLTTSPTADPFLHHIEHYPDLEFQPLQQFSVRDEDDVVQAMAGADQKPPAFFQQALNVASVLVTGDPRATGPYSLFEIEILTTEGNKAAIADAEIRLLDQSKFFPQLASQLSPIFRPEVPGSHILVQIECKSLKVGDAPTMREIVQAPLKPWPECPDISNGCRDKNKCTSKDSQMSIDLRTQGAPDRGDASEALRSKWFPPEPRDVMPRVLEVLERTPQNVKLNLSIADMIRVQAFSATTKKDNTFGIVTSGNYTIVSHRFRDSKTAKEGRKPTLFVSEVIDLDAPIVPYGWLIVSVIIAAYEDAVDRFRV